MYRNAQDTQRWMVAIAAMGCGLGATSAHADVVFDGFVGDPEIAPYFQAFTHINVKDHNAPDTTYFTGVEGAYVSNNTGLGAQSASSTFSLNGASISASATVNPGAFYNARNAVNISISNANAQDGFYVLAGYGTMTTARFFTASALADHANFTWRVTGSESATPSGACNPSANVFNLCSSARLDFAATAAPDPNYFDDLLGASNVLTRFGPGTYTYSIAGMPLDQTITFGYWTSAFVQIEPGQLTQGGNYNFYANYANTYDLVDIDLFDATNNLITDWTLQDLETGENVFTPAGRVATASVPEPSSLGLMGAALAILALLRRQGLRQRRAVARL
jgi:hypothetical protein